MATTEATNASVIVDIALNQACKEEVRFDVAIEADPIDADAPAPAEASPAPAEVRPSLTKDFRTDSLEGQPGPKVDAKA